MNSKKAALFVLVLVMVSVSCNLFAPTSQANGVKSGNIDQGLAGIPAFDPEAPLLSPGAAALRALAADEPGVAALVDDVEAAERAALKAAIAEMKARLDATSNSQNFASLAVSPFGRSSFVSPTLASPSALNVAVPVSYRLQADTRPDNDGSSPLMGDAVLVGGFISVIADMMNDLQATPTKSFPPHLETVNGVTSNMTGEMGKGADGSTIFGMGLQTEGMKNGVSVKTDMTAKLDGQRCPNADGQVSFTIKAHFSSGSGGTALTQDLTTFVRATVNDNAEIVSTTFDVIQGTQQSKGGRQVYVETGETVKYGSSFSNGNYSNLHLNQKTDNATGDEIGNFSSDGHVAAEVMGIIALGDAKDNWLKGGCVKIEADSPGKVDPGSTTSIPVKVVSRFDGSAVSSKLVAALTGGASIDPTSLAKTPGTLTYTAPNENGKSATILLTATSKRGKAKLELTANTGELKKSYQVIETAGIGRTWTGACIDDLAKPFSLGFTAPEQTVSFSFSPVSSTSGSLTETIHFALGGTTMDYTGSGNYEIIPTDKDAEGKVTGMEIAYSSAGNAISCGEGKCVTNKMDMGKGVQIPLRVQDGVCP
jgi:hypothetical protein